MTLADDRLNIDTPENVSFGYPVAGIGSRFLAALVDTLLIVLLQAVVQLTLIALLSVFRNLDLATIEQNWGWLIALFGLVGFAFFWGYYIYFEIAWNGQTPGKRLAGLRVIRADGTPITLSEAIIRNLVRLVDFLPFAYGIGVISMFIDRHSRRLGDLAAGTLVVRDRGTVALSSLGSRQSSLELPIAPQVLAMVADYPLRRLSDQDVQMIEDFLIRRAQLTNPDQVAGQLLGSLLRKMDLTEESTGSLPAETVLTAIVRLSRQWE